jgi:hypothetical protein
VQERADVTSEPVCLGFGLSRTVQLDGTLVVSIALAGATGLGLQRLAPRRGALGEALQRVGQPRALALDVDHPNTIAWDVLRFSLSVPFATCIAEPRRRGLPAP